MTKLTASWVSNGPYGNAVAVGDLNNHARFAFAGPPQSADNVVVIAREEIRNLDDNIVPPRNIPGVPEGPTKEFHGRIENRKFLASKIVSGKLTDRRNNEFRLTGPEGKNTIRAFIRDPERVSSHTLTLVVRHDVNGKTVEHVGTTKLHVRFPLAMVIPSGTATVDTALNMIPRYAASWKAVHPKFRHVVGANMVVTKKVGKLQPTHYDDVIAAISKAAKLATAGVVALSVGHGSDGTTSTTSLGSSPFFNLVPEDNKFNQTGIRFKLRIDKSDLISHDSPPQPGKVVVTPSHNTRVRLDALDRLADALKDTPLRRLILHTCNAGADGEFIQLVANRLRVPVVAQVDFVFFEPNASFYEKDKQATRPRDEKYWPMHRLGSVKFPKKEPPPRLGV